MYKEALKRMKNERSTGSDGIVEDKMYFVHVDQVLTIVNFKQLSEK